MYEQDHFCVMTVEGWIRDMVDEIQNLKKNQKKTLSLCEIAAWRKIFFL